MPLAIIEKAPVAVLTYTIDWTAWLSGADTISTATWTVPSGLTSVLETTTGYKASIKLSGGTAGSTYDLKCHVVTVGGLEDARTLRFVVNER